MTRAFFSSRRADAEELDAFRRQVAEAHVRVFEVRVAGIINEIARLEVREQLIDDRIHGRACGNKHHHCAWLTKQGDELLDIRRAADVPVLRLLAQEVAPHDAQANHADFVLLEWFAEIGGIDLHLHTFAWASRVVRVCLYMGSNYSNLPLRLPPVLNCSTFLAASLLVQFIGTLGDLRG